MPADPEAPDSEVTELVVAYLAGAGVPDAAAAETMPVAGTSVGRAFLQRTPQRLDTFDVDGGLIGAAGPALVLPLRTTDTVAAVIVILRRTGAYPFSDEQLDMMAAFTDQAALASQLAVTQRRMRELDLLTDRDRIARDLHDYMIQRLFAVGVALQGTIPRVRAPEVQQRPSQAVDDLQGVIQDIHTAIFDLHGGSSGATRLRQRLDRAIAAFAESELHTTVQYSGPRSVVDAVLADHAEAVVKEAVSNAVRHADASQLTIHIDVADGLSIDVIGNGKGIPRRDHRKWAGEPAPTRRRGKRHLHHPSRSRRRHPATLVGAAAIARTTEHMRARPADSRITHQRCACRWGGWLIWDF